MAYTRTWDSSYESSPADSQNLNQGATRIREAKKDIRERVAKDHYMDIAGTDADHGEHNKVTFREQASDPATVANKGFLYTKDVSGITELYYRDSAGTIQRLTNGGLGTLQIVNENNIWSGSNIQSQYTITTTTGTVPIDYDNSGCQTLTTTGNVTIAVPTNGHSGAILVLRISLGGAHTVTFNSSWDKASTLSTTHSGSGKVDIYTAYFDGSTWSLVSHAEDVKTSV